MGIGADSAVWIQVDCMRDLKLPIHSGWVYATRMALVLAWGLLGFSSAAQDAVRSLADSGQQSLGPNQSYSHGNPAPAEQLLLEFINRARLNPVGEADRFGIDLNEGLPPQTISATPKAPLAFNAHLLEASHQHVQWMLDTDVFSHIGQGGSGVWDRMQSAGYLFPASGSCSENLAWKGYLGGLDFIVCVTAIHQSLFSDTTVAGRGHRLSLLSEAYQETGAAVRQDLFKGLNSVVIVEDFAATGTDPTPSLLGVVYADQDRNGFYSVGEGLAGVLVMPSDGLYYATTSASGGYAIPLTIKGGAISVIVSGGPLARPITKTVAFTGRNLKLDFSPTTDPPSNPPVRLGAPHVLSGEQVGFYVRGACGQRVVLQSSDDFVRWSCRQTNGMTGLDQEWVDPAARSKPQQFYRALVE